MRKKPVYNDKKSHSWNHGLFGFWTLDLGIKECSWWPHPLIITSNKNMNIQLKTIILKMSDSRSGMKGITIRHRMGRI